MFLHGRLVYGVLVCALLGAIAGGFMSSGQFRNSAGLPLGLRWAMVFESMFLMSLIGGCVGLIVHVGKISICGQLARVAIVHAPPNAHPAFPLGGIDTRRARRIEWTWGLASQVGVMPAHPLKEVRLPFN